MEISSQAVVFDSRNRALLYLVERGRSPDVMGKWSVGWAAPRSFAPLAPEREYAMLHPDGAGRRIFALRSRVAKEYVESEHPRDEDGKWTDAGGAPHAGDPEAMRVVQAELGWRPEVRDEEGQKDVEMLHRLVEERKAAVPRMDALSKTLEGEEVSGHVAQNWDSLSSSAQAEAEQAWKEGNYSSSYEAEVESWREGLPSEIEEAMSLTRDDWRYEGLKEALTDYGFTAESVDATIKEYDPRAMDAADWNKAIKEEYIAGRLVHVDDAPANFLAGGDDPEKQPELPGVPPPTPEEIAAYRERQRARMTREWDSETHAVTADVNKAWEEEVQRRIDHEDPPDYLEESVHEFLDDQWSQMSDEDKYAEAPDSSKEDGAGDEAGIVRMPKNVKTIADGEDYEKTRLLLRSMVNSRAAELFKERGIDADPQAVADELWEGWKGSSGNPIGSLLRRAIKEEFGTWDAGRGAPPGGLSISGSDVRMDPQDAMKVAKAYVRAQWEATQWALANTKDEKGGKLGGMLLYRGLMRPGDEVADSGMSVPGESSSGHPVTYRRVYTKSSGKALSANALQSFTTKSTLANSWNGVNVEPMATPTRVVVRALVPNEAIFSLPAYGKNIHEEQEVVVMGAPLEAWDAWYTLAPTGGNIPFPRTRRTGVSALGRTFAEKGIGTT